RWDGTPRSGSRETRRAAAARDTPAAPLRSGASCRVAGSRAAGCASGRRGRTEGGSGEACRSRRRPGAAGRPARGAGPWGTGSRKDLLGDRPDDRHHGPDTHTRDEVVHVVVVEGHAPLRPVLAAAAVPVDLDQTADVVAARHATGALQLLETRQILGVGVIEHQGAIVVRLARAAHLGDPVAP